MNTDSAADRPLFEVGWEIAEVRVAADFFTAIAALLPLPVYLCFQGTSIEEEVWEFLKEHAVPPLIQIPSGTIWPKSRTVHVLAGTDFVHRFAALAEKHAEPEICDHLHGYNKTRPLIEWYDAFDCPLYVDQSIPEATVAEFCRKLGATFKPYHW